MRFSICVPNFNYAAYLKLTLESVLRQTGAAFEICVADNNSSDGSQALIKRFASENAHIKCAFNATNLGFSDNLLAVSQMATGDWHILLSADDIMAEGTLNFYNDFIDTVGPGKKFAFHSSCDKIDSEGTKIGFLGPRNKVWRTTDIDANLSSTMGCDVYRVDSKEMLRRSLSTFYGPFNFAAACYSASSYIQAGGYTGGRMYNPDKWFHWRLLTVVDEVFFLDKPAFQYRWHSQNQAAIQQKSQALKYLVDEYRNAIEVTPEMLSFAQMDTTVLQRNFIEEVIVKQAFAAIKNGRRKEASRVLYFGLATFPVQSNRSKLFWTMKGLLLLGPIGAWAAKIIRPQF